MATSAPRAPRLRWCRQRRGPRSRQGLPDHFPARTTRTHVRARTTRTHVPARATRTHVRARCQPRRPWARIEPSPWVTACTDDAYRYRPRSRSCMTMRPGIQAATTVSRRRPPRVTSGAVPGRYRGAAGRAGGPRSAAVPSRHRPRSRASRIDGRPSNPGVVTQWAATRDQIAGCHRSHDRCRRPATPWVRSLPRQRPRIWRARSTSWPICTTSSSTES